MIQVSKALYSLTGGFRASKTTFLVWL